MSKEKEIKRKNDHARRFGIAMSSTVEASEIMANRRIETLKVMSFSLRSSMFLSWKKFKISLPVIRTIFLALDVFYFCDEFFPGPIITISTFEGDGLSSEPIISDPDPKLFRFF